MWIPNYFSQMIGFCNLSLFNIWSFHSDVVLSRYQQFGTNTSESPGFYGPKFGPEIVNYLVIFILFPVVYF